MKTLDQERASFAWERTNGATKELKIVASGAPALIMQNGLMQALAYYKDKDKEKSGAVRTLLGALVARLSRQLGVEASFDAVMKKLHGADADLYFRATEETLETLRWIRQFAKARVKG